MKKRILLILAVLVLTMPMLVLPASPAAAAGPIVTADLASGVTAQDLVQTLLGPGIQIQNVTYSGSAQSAGTFSGGTGIIGFEQGIVLSSGDIGLVVGPNTSDGSTLATNYPGDANLNTLASPYSTLDAAVLEFDFKPAGGTVTFDYVFGSEEYNEYANTSYNDVFGFFLNGTNVALLPDGVTVVSINHVNGGNPYGYNAHNPAYFINNDLQDGGGSINTELDGLTVVLSVEATVVPNTWNHIKLAIADASDRVLDSDVFIRAESFVSIPDLLLEPFEATNETGESHTVTATYTLDGVPQAGVTVNFGSFGPNPDSGTAVTDQNGVATWSYTGTNEGTDQILAYVGDPNDPANYVESNTVTKTWEAPANLPPVADPGSYEAVEQSSLAGAEITLDGSGSYDPEGEPLTYSWTWSTGFATGASPTVSLPLGDNAVTLVVNDGMLDSEPVTTTVTVSDTAAPSLTINESVNPHGQNVPGEKRSSKAKSKAVNPDGFYEVAVSDICDANPELWIGTAENPYLFQISLVDGKIVLKVTESPDSDPEIKSIGSTNGRAGAVAFHVILPAEPVVTAIDDSGNVIQQELLVPPPPK